MTIRAHRRSPTVHHGSTEPGDGLESVHALFASLNSARIRYCHWKSNTALADGLSGLTDIDLLVDRRHADAFRAVLAHHGFKPADGAYGGSFPSAEHFFGFDEPRGVLVHVHGYFRVITGESLAKNFRLPLEDMLLENSSWRGYVRVPIPAAELVVFTLRTMLKHTTIVELVLLARDWKDVLRESEALLDADTVKEATRLAHTWLPALDPALFQECVSALRTPQGVVARLVLARRLRASIRMYARRPRVVASWTGISAFARMAVRRLAHRPRGLVLRSGGGIVAFVGPEATGKSTLIEECSQWLGAHFVLRRVHAGKPPSTALTWLPTLVVPLLRRVMPGRRPSALEARHPPTETAQPADWVYPISFAIRAVLMAYDRRALLVRAFAHSANGAIVLCDRYPFDAPGSPDGPRLMHYAVPRSRYPVRSFLSRLERRLYLQIPPPDLVISLTAPVDVAIARNRTRGKREPEEYVRRRHRAAAIPSGRVPVCSIDTNQELKATLLDVKQAIWSVL